MRLVFDIETDGLLPDVTKAHCIVLKDIDTNEIIKAKLKKAMQLLSEADEIIIDVGISTISIFILISSWYSLENFAKNQITKDINTNEINIFILPLLPRAFCRELKYGFSCKA